MRPIVRDKLHSWVYTLLYPAVLGSMFVAIGMHLTEPTSGASLYNISFGCFLVLYFSSQHVENSLDRDAYSYPQFFSNLFEMAAMFILFALLGIFGTRYKIADYAPSSWQPFFIILALVFLAPVIARMLDNSGNPFKNFRSRCLSCLSLLAALVSFGGILLGASFWVLGILTVTALVYFLFFVFDISGKNL